MRKTIEVVTCDIKDCGLSTNILNENIQVIFTTEQTEGRSIPHYLSMHKIDLCSDCKKHLLSGHPIFGQGAMGYNTYWFKS